MGDFEKGAVLDGRYEILGVLGSGGMGCVYKARQLHLDRMVAIKIPSASIQENTEFLARFIREARACAKIAHDHIVAIYDVHSGERPYIVMEYVDGMPLHHYLHEQATAIFVSDLLDIIGQICDGLAEAHARGVVHRDIKPGNIVITRNTQRVKIMDFGIARISDETGLTVSGSLMGTPYYMSPEQIRGIEAGPAADLYALAAMVYQLFTGRQVFEGNISSLVYKHVHEQPKRPSSVNAALPDSFDSVVLRALAKKPENRQESTVEFCRELRMTLRSLMNLPLSQIFASPAQNADASVLNTAPTKPTPHPAPETEARLAYAEPLQPNKIPIPPAGASAGNAARNTMPVDPYAPTMQVAPGMQLDARESADNAGGPEAIAKANEAAPNKKRSISPWILVVPLVIAVVAVGAFLAMQTRDRGAGPATNQAVAVEPLDAGVVSSNPAETNATADGTHLSNQPAQGGTAPEATTAPVAAAAAVPNAELRWVRAPLPEYQVEDYLTVMWRSLPPPSPPHRPIYRLNLQKIGAEGQQIPQFQTRENKWAFHLTEPGEYLLRVEVAQNATGASSALESAIRVLP